MKKIIWKYKYTNRIGITTIWYGDYYCKIMNKIDFRFWNCECYYTPPFGKVIMAGCINHD